MVRLKIDKPGKEYAMEHKRKRPPYREFMSWMIINDVSRSEIKDLLGLTDATLSHRLNGTGADFSIEEIRMLLNEYGNGLVDFFLI